MILDCVNATSEINFKQFVSIQYHQDMARDIHFGYELRNSFDQHGVIVWLITFAYLYP